MIQLLLTLALCGMSNAFMTSGYFVESSGCPEITAENYPYDQYSHTLVGSLLVAVNGTAMCDTSDLVLKRFVQLGSAHSTLILLREGIPNTAMAQIIARNASWDAYRATYLATVRSAVVACGCAGIEFDHEFDTVQNEGYVTPLQATQYTQFLSEVKAALGPGMLLNVDMGVFGVTLGSFPLMFNSWLNASMVRNGAVDYINTMSYHLNSNIIPIWDQYSTSILPWEKDFNVLTVLWDLPAEKINLGIPFYSFNKTTSEPAWCLLSALPSCQNIDPQLNKCQDIRFVGKQQIFNIGKLVKDKGMSGIFVFASGYDTLSYNNTLITYGNMGMNS